jgi:hypothetical protein
MVRKALEYEKEAAATVARQFDAEFQELCAILSTSD